MQATNIEWADWTWNPVRGCSRISPGCMNCYAEAMAARFSGDGFERDPDGDHPHSTDCTCDDCEHERKNERQPFYGFAYFRIIDDRREPHWTGFVELIESKLLEPLSWRKKALRFAQEHGRKPRVFVNSMSDLFHERLPDEAIDRVFAVMALAPMPARSTSHGHAVCGISARRRAWRSS